MSAEILILPFPRRVCAGCGRDTNNRIELFDEDGQPRGFKLLCEEYPFCTHPSLADSGDTA